MSSNCPDEVKRLLLLYRWKTGVCLACVDELAEKGGIRYRPENLEATTWADLPGVFPRMAGNSSERPQIAQR